MARRFSIAKTMLITGASSGIGKEAAKVFTADGWNVVATMRSPGKEQDLVPSDNLMLTRLDLQNAFVKRVCDQTGLDN
jgi:NAD(P)-dependent dehydrogenase (short-subunit alcohol dehydrogenase family)